MFLCKWSFKLVLFLACKVYKTWLKYWHKVKQKRWVYTKYDWRASMLDKLILFPWTTDLTSCTLQLLTMINLYNLTWDHYSVLGKHAYLCNADKIFILMFVFLFHMEKVALYIFMLTSDGGNTVRMLGSRLRFLCSPRFF